MEAAKPADAEARPSRHSRRRRRAWWKRKRVWIIVIATGVAILLVLWLISSVGSYKEPD